MSSFFNFTLRGDDAEPEQPEPEQAMERAPAAVQESLSMEEVRLGL